jgi:uncharacterized protein YgiM (DUF1202 family)
MKHLLLALLFSITAIWADEPVDQCLQVNAPVGLVIRSKPSSDSKRLGSLAEGEKVTLAGKAEKGMVVPVIVKDAKDAEASWIQITKPKASYVLYRAGGTAPYDYLVPCVK